MRRSFIRTLLPDRGHRDGRRRLLRRRRRRRRAVDSAGRDRPTRPTAARPTASPPTTAAPRRHRHAESDDARHGRGGADRRVGARHASSPTTSCAAASATTCPASPRSTPRGEHVGFDADFCRVIAAAVLGDADEGRVRRRRRPTTGSPRCSPARSTCSSATRRGRPAATAPKARRSSTDVLRRPGDDGRRRQRLRQRSTTWTARSSASPQGTTTEGNAATEFARLGLDLGGPVVRRRRPDPGGVRQAGQCDGWSSRHQPAHRPPRRPTRTAPTR